MVDFVIHLHDNIIRSQPTTINLKKKISVNCYCTKKYWIKYDFVEQEFIDV